MASANSTRATSNAQPSTPLKLHKATGQYRKFINGKYHYFGADKREALRRYHAEKDDILNGRKHQARRSPSGGSVDYISVKEMCNRFLHFKKSQVDAGDLSQRQWDDLCTGCKSMAAEFGDDRNVADLRPDDFGKLRDKISRKKNGDLIAPIGLKKKIANIKSVLRFAAKNLLDDVTVKTGTQFEKPSEKQIVRRRNEVGSRTLSADQIQLLLTTASASMRAMILLGINCGFGNADCKTLRSKDIDLESGWIDMIRQKTAVKRRCKLWDETIENIKESLSGRVEPLEARDTDLVFVTRHGNPYGRTEGADCPISKEFRKLLDAANCYQFGRSFYSLRHTFETEAGDCENQVAVNVIMGHKDASIAAVYRDRVKDPRLESVAKHVHCWLFKSECTTNEQ